MIIIMIIIIIIIFPHVVSEPPARAVTAPGL
jgi:hypothetical protein